MASRRHAQDGCVPDRRACSPPQHRLCFFVACLVLLVLAAARREEKRRLLRRHGELKEECAHLEEEDQQLNKTLQVSCLLRQRDAHSGGLHFFLHFNSLMSKAQKLEKSCDNLGGPRLALGSSGKAGDVALRRSWSSVAPKSAPILKPRRASAVTFCHGSRDALPVTVGCRQRQRDRFLRHGASDDAIPPLLESESELHIFCRSLSCFFFFFSLLRGDMLSVSILTPMRHGVARR